MFFKPILLTKSFDMTTLDIITIILFSLGVVLVGLAFSQKGKSMQSFFAANGTMPWYMSGLSLFMGFFSAGTFVVWGSIAYSMGWVSITIQWTHFLFNTLNNIYSLIQLDPDRAQQTVHDLSRLLRYVLYDSSRPTVPLKAEMDFLGNYIELMRIRLPRHVRLDVSLPENPSHTLVAPLLFISLVENAFKHGVSNDRPSFIDIDIREEEGVLACRIENSFFPKSEADRSGSGIGLAVADEIITMHGGRLDITSELNVGTNVTITLPVESQRRSSAAT